MDRLSYLLLRIIVFIFSVLPFPVLYKLSDLIAFSLHYLLRYRYKVIRQNLEHAFPNKSPENLEQIIKKFYKNLSDILLESLKGLSLTESELKKRYRYANPEIFDTFYSQHKHVILLGGHFANWEWGVLSFPLWVKAQVIGIFKPLNNRHINDFLNRRRQKWGLHLISMAATGRNVQQPKARPSMYVLIADQSPSTMQNAHWVQFLNRDTPFINGPDKLARRTGYPVYIFDIQRIERGYYEVNFRCLTLHPEKLPEGAITKLFAEGLVQMIQFKPEDWLWSHRRWKKV